MLPDLEALLAMHARILREAIDFEELCDWFAAHFSPVPRKPWPPR